MKTIKTADLMSQIHSLRSEGIISGAFKCWNDKRKTDRRIKLCSFSVVGFANLVRVLAHHNVEFKIHDASTVTFTADHDGTIHQVTGRKVA